MDEKKTRERKQQEEKSKQLSSEKGKWDEPDGNNNWVYIKGCQAPKTVISQPTVSNSHVGTQTELSFLAT